MDLVKWDPFRDMEHALGRFNRFLGQPKQTGDRENVTAAEWAPAVDISESEKEFLIKAEVPGIPKESINVSIHEGILTIKGERMHEKEAKGEKFHRVERSYGRFVRSFTLPDYVEETAVLAEYQNGVLNLHLPKTEKAKPKAIEVKVKS